MSWESEGIRVQLRGDRAIQRALNKLSRVVGKRAAGRVEKKALKAGASPILMEAKRRAPKGTAKGRGQKQIERRPPGNLRRSLAVTRGKRIRRYPSGIVLAVIGPQWPLGAHAHLVEFGTKRRTTEAGKNLGRVEGKPFLGPAFKARLPDAERKIHEVFKREIAREWEKHIHKGQR